VRIAFQYFCSFIIFSLWAPLTFAKQNMFSDFNIPSPQYLRMSGFPETLPSTALFIREHTSRQTCSAVLVSDDGHALTAYHCLSNCLRSNPWFGDSIKFEQEDGSHAWVFSPRINSESPSCLLSIFAPRKAGSNAHTAKVEIVAGPECMAFEENYPSPHGLLSTFSPKDKKWAEKNGFTHCDKSRDTVLIKIDLSKFSDSSCAPIASNISNQGTAVLALGFPTYTMRGSKDSQGHTLYASSGHIVAPGACSISYLDGAQLHVSTPQKFSRELLVTTTDIVPSSSGSGLFDRKGNVTGVASFILSPWQDQTSYCKGGSIFANPLFLNLPKMQCVDRLHSRQDQPLSD